MSYLITLLPTLIGTLFVLKYTKIDIGTYEENANILQKDNVEGGYRFQFDTWLPIFVSFFSTFRDYCRIWCVLWIFSDHIEGYSFVSTVIAYSLVNFIAISILDREINSKEFYLQLLFGVCYTLEGDVKIAESLVTFLSSNLYFIFENNRMRSVIFAEEDKGNRITIKQFNKIKEVVSK